MNIQQHLTKNSLTWKEIELDLFRALQNAFAELFTALLEDIDRQLAETRDKRRYYLKDKRRTTIQTLFGEVTFERNYYDLTVSSAARYASSKCGQPDKIKYWK
ncbi:hypothetical protein B4110_2782 [Parageobacillus toebii]|uniref:ISLre2 family transposase n=1 Tax=Parageobacillus toebii TaxID=153151 RepID=A0A150N2A2_9BACL|nr:hypothetical protein B4110_2782 [Parageobacillus toebii]